MNRVLITGMSGVGKTTVVNALRDRHFRAIDTDEPGWSHFDELGHQRWNVKRLLEAMADPSSIDLFVSGCSEDQVDFYPQFSSIILLSAPKKTIKQRLRSRTNNSYGKDAAKFSEVMKNLDEIEPLLRKRCTHEIVTTESVQVVVDRLLDFSCLSHRTP